MRIPLASGDGGMVWKDIDTLVIERWFALGVLGLILAVVSAYAVRTAVAGRKHDPRVAREGGSILLGAWAMEAFYWVIRGLSRVLLKTGLSPDALTMASLFLTLGCIPLAATGELALAGVMLIVGSIFDAFDGIVARERKIASDAGEVLDAVVDRYADAAPLIGLCIYYRGSIWQMSIPLFAIVGSMMVSYVRAKAESMQIDLPPTLMRRHERIAYLCVSLILGPAVSSYIGTPGGAENVATLAVVAFIGVVANYAAIKMTIQTRARLVDLGRGPGGKK
jgi:CDP-diacylglycerol--glycerol-3-phosphate 3-phosphatidyltransferase